MRLCLVIDKVRLDKWLWAARFFKTRSLAKQAIEGGKVHYNRQRVKVSKDVDVGAEVRIRISDVERTIMVMALSNQRRGASEARLLYEETAESVTAREQQAVLNKQLQSHLMAPPTKPSKKDRRQIHQFKEQSRN
jgi:ribosome-associated heat shock protein Hsp15